MKKRLAIMFAVTLIASVAMTACSKDKGPKDGETTEDLQDTSVVITMDTSMSLDAGTVLNIMDVAQVKEEKSALVDKFGFMVDGSTFQENYTVIEGDNLVTVVAQFTDGEQFVEMLSFTGTKSDINIPTEVLNKFKDNIIKVSNGLTFTDVDGYNVQDISATTEINGVSIENILSYIASDESNDIESITIQSINGTKESLLESNKAVLQLLFGTIMSESVEESELESLLAIEGNEDKLTEAFDNFYNEIITVVNDETIVSAKFYNIDGSIVETPIETTFIDTSFINGGKRLPIAYTQYLNVNDKLIGITYTTKQVDTTDTVEKEYNKVSLDETIFEQGGVKTFFTKVFEGMTHNDLGIGVKPLTDVSFLSNSIVIGELNFDEEPAEVPIVDNEIEVGETEPEVTEVIEIKEAQKKPYAERFKDFYVWPENSKYTYSRYVYILSGLTDSVQPSTFIGSITDKKNGTVKVSGSDPSNSTSIDMNTGNTSTGNNSNDGSNNSGGQSSTPTVKTSFLVGNSGRSHEISNANLEEVVFDEVNSTTGMIPITFNGDRYYIATMTPTEISRVIGSTGTKPEQSLYAMSDFKNGEFLVTKDNSVTDGTTCYNITYTSISDGTKKTAPYMACLPTVSSQDWIVIYGDNLPESMNVLRALLTGLVIK